MFDANPTTEPLKPWTRRAILAAVIFFHVGAGWALTRIHHVPIVAGDALPMQVSFVQEALPQAPQPEPPKEEPPPEPQQAPPQLESMIQPAPPDLPPPVFPVPKPPEAPKPPPKPVAQPKPPPASPRPQQVTPSAPAPPAAPKSVSASQVGYLTPPQPIYPARSRRAGETGTVMLRVLIDASGTPAQVTMQHSSGHPALDESALSAVRAARFRPYAEGGLAQSVWVLVPINFVLQ